MIQIKPRGSVAGPREEAGEAHLSAICAMGMYRQINGLIRGASGIVQAGRTRGTLAGGSSSHAILRDGGSLAGIRAAAIW
jgi:hypothetical protein